MHPKDRPKFDEEMLAEQLVINRLKKRNVTLTKEEMAIATLGCLEGIKAVFTMACEGLHAEHN